MSKYDPPHDLIARFPPDPRRLKWGYYPKPLFF